MLEAAFLAASGGLPARQQLVHLHVHEQQQEK